MREYLCCIGDSCSRRFGRPPLALSGLIAPTHRGSTICRIPLEESRERRTHERLPELEPTGLFSPRWIAATSGFLRHGSPLSALERGNKPSTARARALSGVSPIRCASGWPFGVRLIAALRSLICCSATWFDGRRPRPTLRVEESQLESMRDVGDRGLSTHAVAGLVQRR